MIEHEIMQLHGLTVSELKDVWNIYFETTPTHGNKAFLMSRIAYRMQELAYGGLSNDIMEHLSKNIKFAMPKFHRPRNLPPAGTRIVKTYHGQEFNILVLDKGFEYNGKYYHSLSAIAQEVTGHKVSGYYFFGMHNKGI